mmetsp:Transcript_21541/g.45088  ORF Transcript_21541/g.45088 Transcript_21541/m.45088 type:complete len:206 (-) Transcript_21541:2933-3550(-)
MPSSKYVYAGANQRTGSVPNRRRSQRIRRNSIGKPSSSSNNFSDDERIDDPDETMLEEDKDETILLSDDEEIIFGSGEGKMDADEKFAKNDNQRSRSRSRSRSHHPASSSSSSSWQRCSQLSYQTTRMKSKARSTVPSKTLAVVARRSQKKRGKLTRCHRPEKPATTTMVAEAVATTTTTTRKWTGTLNLEDCWGKMGTTQHSMH